MAIVLHTTTMLPSSGHWIWKDDTCGLEFVSNAVITEKIKRGKKQETKGNSRSLSSRVAGFGKKPSCSGRGLKLYMKKDTTEHSFVCLNDIKVVAFGMMSEVKMMPESFDGLMNAEQFDEFLLYLLSYFSCFFERKNQENKKNPMYIEPSLSEKQAYANAIQRTSVALKLLAQSYCSLILGLGLDEQHHMECGMSRVSSTYKDRAVFETFYTYCTFVVWITFRRNQFDNIKKEIGRMLRSDTFNPATKVIHSPNMAKDAEQKKKATMDTCTLSVLNVSPSHYRRLHPKRPPIKSIVSQRSPAIVSILPLPREQSPWLFQPGGMSTPDHLELEIENHFPDLLIDMKTFKIGILGEPYAMFNPVTLTPLGADVDGQERVDDREKNIADDAAAVEGDFSEPSGPSRQPTAASHVTTDVHTDDDDDTY